MSQVVRTTNELIINSLYLLGELGVGEPADAFMLSTGIELINEILDKFSVDGIYIPYYTTLDFTMVTGQSDYTISDMITDPSVNSNRIVDLTFANYTVDFGGSPIIYPVKVMNRSSYKNNTILPTVEARPGFAIFTNYDDRSVVTFYPTPDRDYQATLQVKSMLSSMSPQQSLSGLPPYFYGFLKYALARKFKAYYPSANWSAENEQEYQDYFQNLKDGNEIDMVIKPSSVLESPEPFYWYNIMSY